MEEAIEGYQFALEIEKNLGEDHIEYANTWINLSVVLEKSGDH